MLDANLRNTGHPIGPASTAPVEVLTQFAGSGPPQLASAHPTMTDASRAPEYACACASPAIVANTMASAATEAAGTPRRKQ
jgi:hypothetical protein